MASKNKVRLNFPRAFSFEGKHDPGTEMVFEGQNQGCHPPWTHDHHKAERKNHSQPLLHPYRVPSARLRILYLLLCHFSSNARKSLPILTLQLVKLRQHIKCGVRRPGRLKKAPFPTGLAHFLQDHWFQRRMEVTE